VTVIKTEALPYHGVGRGGTNSGQGLKTNNIAQPDVDRMLLGKLRNYGLFRIQ
jgi:hypothetical protein